MGGDRSDRTDRATYQSAATGSALLHVAAEDERLRQKEATMQQQLAQTPALTASEDMPSYLVGQFIGRRGRHIQEMERALGARMTYDNKTAQVKISARSIHILQAAQTEVRKWLRDHMQRQPLSLTLSLLKKQVW